MRALHPDCFDNPDIFSSESELFSLEILFHVLLVGGAGQRKHPGLYGKPENNLREAGP